MRGSSKVYSFVRCLDKTKDEVFILMEKRLQELYKQSDSYQILEKSVL